MFKHVYFIDNKDTIWFDGAIGFPNATSFSARNRKSEKIEESKKEEQTFHARENQGKHKNSEYKKF